MEAIAGIAEKYGRGEVYITARTEFEIPGISEEDFSDLQEELAKIGVVLAACGPRMRSVVSCKGSVCVHGNIDTFRVAWEIDQRYNNSDALPHKFKVGVAGCASSCSKPSLNDVGLVGVREPYLVDVVKCNGCGLCSKVCHMEGIRNENSIAVLYKERCVGCGDCVRVCTSSALTSVHTGVDIYAGGRWGRAKQVGIRIARFLTETDAIETVGRIKEWYRKNGLEGERLGGTMLRTGVKAFQEAVLQNIKQEKWFEITAEVENAFIVIR
jgi:dissimilatory sulfite reductase (desulfoviridin) alpha/beta subunit